MALQSNGIMGNNVKASGIMGTNIRLLTVKSDLSSLSARRTVIIYH